MDDAWEALLDNAIALCNYAHAAQEEQCRIGSYGDAILKEFKKRCKKFIRVYEQSCDKATFIL